MVQNDDPDSLRQEIKQSMLALSLETAERVQELKGACAPKEALESLRSSLPQLVTKLAGEAIDAESGAILQTLSETAERLEGKCISREELEALRDEFISLVGQATTS